MYFKKYCRGNIRSMRIMNKKEIRKIIIKNHKKYTQDISDDILNLDNIKNYLLIIFFD